MNFRPAVSVVVFAAAGFAGCSRISTDTPTYSVGGTLGGLAGTGLTLRLNGGSSLSPNANGAFVFGTQLPAGAAYSVTVSTQPTNPSQFCSVTGGSGTMGQANVTGVSVNCVAAFTIGGSVSGLLGTGLVLRNNGGDDRGISANGPFSFSTNLANAAAYSVSVFVQPTNPNQTCVVTNGAGTVAGADVTSVSVACTADTFAIGSLADPLATQQWHLKNTGQNAFADGTGLAGMDINVEPVFSNLGIVGANVTVAVVDSGLEIAHEDLFANVVPGGSWDFIGNDDDPTNSVDFDGDHGTSVSGLIAMARNSLGGIGVAPRARLKGFNFLSMPLPTRTAFLASLGASTSSPNSSDVFIFNQSFGISPTNDITVDPVVEAHYLAGVTGLRGGKGALYVKAAGNGFRGFTDTITSQSADCSRGAATRSFVGGTFTGLSCENANFDPENTLPYQIVVGATNADGVRASYSSAGAAIWVSAPGGEGGRNAALSGGAGTVTVEPAMVTTDQSSCAIGYSTNTAQNGSFFDNGGAPNSSCNYTNGFNGTSSATPVTVGVIALILEANPALTWRDLKHILASTARRIDAGRAAVSVALAGGGYIAEPAWTTNAAGFNFHNWYGFGLVDASAAVNMARNYNLAQLGAFANTGFVSSGALNLPIPNNSVNGATHAISVPASPVGVIEAVQISVAATHPASGDLGIELVSPQGTRSVLKNIRDGFAGSANLSGMVLLSNAFYGESPAGPWTLKVVDGDGANSADGTLNGWSIRVFGH